MSKICSYSWYQQQDVCLCIYYYIFIEDVLLIVELGLVFEKLQILLRVQIMDPLKICLWAIFPLMKTPSFLMTQNTELF